MFTEINKFFTSDIPLTHTVFYRGSNTVSFGEFSRDVACMANVFSKIEKDTVILFVPDDIYLFFVYFMGLMQAGKDVILPAMLTEQNIGTLGNMTNTIVTNQHFEFPGFCLVDVSKRGADTWNFCDMDNRLLYFFTSGSTGTPKKICKTFHNLSAEVAQHNKMQRHLFEKNPVMVASIAPYHMYGLLWRFLVPLAGGVSIDTDMIFTPEELQCVQQKYSNILFATTPSFLDGITRYQNQYEFKNNCIGIYSSGSLLNEKTSTKALEIFGVSPFEIFGSTETGGVAFRQQKAGLVWTVFEKVKTTLNENGCIVADSEFCCARPYKMSDIVEMQNEKQFILKNRADRVVKIAEERISLPEYEEKLSAHTFIERSYVTSVEQNGRIVIGCVIVLTDQGKQFIIDNGRHAFTAKIKKWLMPYFPAVALPRKIRIVNTMPMNTQGKILKSEISEILRSGTAEPIATNIIKTENSFSGDLVFLPDSAYFKGHFEGCPVLPGVMQLHFVFKYINLFFYKNAKVYDVIKLKFTNLILPNTSVHFELNKLSDDEFTFSYEKDGLKYSAGKVVIKE